MSKGHNKGGRGHDFNGALPNQYQRQEQSILDPKRMTYRPFKARSEYQAQALDIIRSNALTIIIGPAGSAKTFLAAAMAMEALQSGSAQKLIAARPAIEAGDSIGYLSGDLAAKVDPYLRPVLDNLEYFVGPSQMQMLRAQGVIEVTSLTYVRGRSFHDCVVIYDEMQNATPAQLKMCLTRAGENCRMVVTMDPGQCDLPDSKVSAAEIVDILADRNDVAIIEFGTKDIVRSQLVKTVVKAFEELENR